MAGLDKNSLVSFWKSDRAVGREDFECSGVFVADRLILTAKHAVEKNCKERWVRPHADAMQAYRIVDDPVFHPDLDAALVQIEVMPGGCVAADLDISGNANAVAEGLSLHGYFEGRYEAVGPVKLLSFEAIDRVHVVDVKQPRGHSGSGLAHQDRLWGITVCHYADPNVHRGCAISVGQLWPSWLEKFVRDAAARDPLVREIPRHDLPLRVSEIRALVANDEIDLALKRLFDVVRDFSTDDDVDVVCVLSMKYRVVERRGPDHSADLVERVDIATKMLRLLNDLVQRLRKEMDGD